MGEQKIWNERREGSEYEIRGEFGAEGEPVIKERIIGEDMQWYSVPDSEFLRLYDEFMRRLSKK